MNEHLRQSYRECGRIARRHGKTYATAAQLLPASSRRHVHAVYAFCRYADDIVDDTEALTPGERAVGLSEFGRRFRADLASGTSDHPILAATVATVLQVRIDPDCFDRFLTSMEQDLHVDTYPTWPDLLGYMDGSAAVIGEMMLPVLGGPRSALEPARALGIAFQLTNFLRDVGEDLDRGRVYLPQEDLARFGADPWLRRVTPQWRALMRFQIDRARRIYREADTGIAALPSRSAKCIYAARILYSRILDHIEAADYDVFTRRARVPTVQKALIAGRTMLRHAPVGVPRAPA